MVQAVNIHVALKPISIVLSLKIVGDKSVAMKIERAIKKLSRAQKEKIIALPSLLSEYSL